MSGGLEVDDELVLSGLLDGKVARLGTFEDAIDVCCRYFRLRSLAEVPDVPNFLSLLRLDGERRGEEAAGHGTEESSTLHYSIT